MKRRYSYQQFGQGMVENTRRAPMTNGEISIFRIGFWLIVGTISLLLTIQIGLILVDMNFSALLAGKGSLTGVITDQAGHALAAEIFVQGTPIKAKADASGRFSVEDIPSGKRAIVINYYGMSKKYEIQINAGSQVDLGDIRLSPTQ